MTGNDGTYAKLADMAKKQETSKKPPTFTARPKPEPSSSERIEDLYITPYISQTFRLTEDELRWVRKQAFIQTEKLGEKVTQNMIVRIALRSLREACAENPKENPLLESLSRRK